MPRNDTVTVGSDKTGAAKIDEQKHESFPRSSLHSALAPPNLFSIFTKNNQQAKIKSRKTNRTGKSKIHPPGNNQKITQHFRPVKTDLDNSKRPNDPEATSDQKIGDKVQLRFVG